MQRVKFLIEIITFQLRTKNASAENVFAFRAISGLSTILVELIHFKQAVWIKTRFEVLTNSKYLPYCSTPTKIESGFLKIWNGVSCVKGNQVVHYFIKED